MNYKTGLEQITALNTFSGTALILLAIFLWASVPGITSTQALALILFGVVAFSTSLMSNLKSVATVDLVLGILICSLPLLIITVSSMTSLWWLPEIMGLQRRTILLDEGIGLLFFGLFVVARFLGQK